MPVKQIPILYSLQNCPYAIRTRFCLFKAQQQVLIRAIKLNNKPPHMLQVSPKGEVPVLIIADTVLDESLDIMFWALANNDPEDLLHRKNPTGVQDIRKFIEEFENSFIPALEAYCCAKRYHEDNLDECRQHCMHYLQQLETRLTAHKFLLSNQESILDIAIFPFIRKFARVERQWYLQSPYPRLRLWLEQYLQSPLFTKVMNKHALWLESKNDIYLLK